MLENPAKEIINQIEEISEETEEVFYMSAEFWVSVTFLVVVIILFSPITKKIKDLIQKRINRIREELNEAESIKLEAQRLYADTERKLLNIENEVEDIKTNKQYLIDQTKDKKISELNYTMQRKKEDLDAKIEQASVQLNTEINGIICKKAIKILNNVISAKLTKKEYSTLIDNSIENIKNTNIGC